ncbi:hypothetical protein [Hymenobacter coalescens]
MFLYYAHAALCLLLALGLTWQSRRTGRGRRRLVRLVAGLLAALALWFTAYPPQYRVTTTAGAAILLTPGYEPDSVRALRRRFASAPIFRYRPLNYPGGDTLALTSLSALNSRVPNLNTLHIVGAGLPTSDLPALPSTVRVVTHPTASANQFASAAWNRRVALGQALRIEGRFTGQGTDPIWVRLSAAGSSRDSVRLPASGGRFALRYVPRRTGRLLARLEARSGRTRVASEPVPVEVQPARPLRVLILAGTPSFELNLLKNHLAERGHQVALRLRLSPGLQQTEVQNRSRIVLGSLSAATWRGFDVAIADADGLNALSASEARLLTAATAEGLGVLLVGTTELPRPLPGRTDFALQATSTTLAERPQPIRWPEGSASTVLPALLRSTPRTRALISGPTRGSAAAAARRTGWGTVVVATPASTYQWLLSGATARYDSYWTTLLSTAARPLEPAAYWTTPLWPRLHEPQVLRLTAAQAPRRAGGRVETPAAGVVGLPLRQSPAQPDVWEGRFWPAAPGWHRAVAPGQDTAAFYVFNATEWPGPLQAQQLRALQQLPDPDAASPAHAAVRWETWIPATWFFALFVLAAGWLWLDEKR